MAKLKTEQNDGDVEAFLNRVDDEKKRDDAFATLDIMKKITRTDPKMWGPSIVGFGSYHYRYASGREGDWFLCGFSPRKQNLTLYIMAGFGSYGTLLANLGKHKTGKSCLYVKRLDDIHLPTLKKLIKASVAHVKKSNA